MTVTQYPDIVRIRKELNLLQKLYGLFNAVMDSIDGYYDILWSEVDIEKINNELMDFQNKCRKLPKALKEWQAFNDLKKKIEDFNETCPLLERMLDRAMKERHWKRIEEVTKWKFDVESEGFLLRHVMEAPLLQHMEDIEVCMPIGDPELLLLCMSLCVPPPHTHTCTHMHTHTHTHITHTTHNTHTHTHNTHTTHTHAHTHTHTHTLANSHTHTDTHRTSASVP